MPAGVVARALGAALLVTAAAAPQAQMRSEQSLPATFNQGVARVPGGWILSGTNSPIPSTDILARTDDDLHVLATLPSAIPPQWKAQGFDHIGDIDVVGNTIYAPFEQPDYSKGVQATARYDATTLLFVAIDPKSMTAYSMDHFDGDALLRYDVRAGWKPLAPLKLSMLLHRTQGAAVGGGAVWISTDDDRHGIYRVDPATGHVDLVGTLGHPGGEGEGLDAAALSSGSLHGLVIDPNLTTVWLVHLALTAPAAATTTTTTSVGATRPSSRHLVATGGDASFVWAGVAALVAATGAGSVSRRSRRRSRPTGTART